MGHCRTGERTTIQQLSTLGGFRIVLMLSSSAVRNCIVKFKNRKELSKVCFFWCSTQIENDCLWILYLERARLADSTRQSGSGNGDSSLGRGQLNIPDESTLSRFVAARLDLPISQSMLDRNFKLSIIKRCWEDQLRLKRKTESSLLFLTKEWKKKSYYFLSW